MSESELIASPAAGAGKKAMPDWAVMLCLYGGTLIVHILLTLCTTIFNLTPDEYSVTAVAAYFNGMDWSSTVSTGGYYGYFQSLFYIPVFSLTDEPYLRYRIMLIINGVLMSFIPVIIYYLSRKKFEVSKPVSAFFAVICGLYPSYLLLTKYTWNETMCDLLPWVFLLLMYSAMDCTNTVKKQVLSVLGGLTLAAAYATHGRMLALLAAGVVLVLVVFFSMKKKRVFCLTGFFGAVAAGLVGDKLMKSFIQNALWKVGEGKTPTNTIEKMFTRLVSTGEGGVSAGENVSIEKFLDTLVGHFFYFISSTWGFGAICVVVIITTIVLYYKRRNKQPEYGEDGAVKAGTGPYIEDKTAVLCWFALLAMGAIFVVSVAFKATSNLFSERMDTVMYGRYTEVFYPIAIFAALLLIYKGKLGMVQTFAAMVFAGVIDLLTELMVVPVVLGGDRFVSAMVMGLAPLRFGEGMKELYTGESFIKIIAATSVMLFVWVIVKLLMREKRSLHLFFSVPLAVLLAYTSVFCYNSYTLPQSKNADTGAKYVKEAFDLLAEETDSVTLVNVPRDKQVKAQFLYPEMKIELVSSITKLAKLETLPAVMASPQEDALALWTEGIYLVGDRNNICIYVADEELAERFREKGCRVSDGNRVEYNAVTIPATSSVVKSGVSADADLNYVQHDEESVTALLPNGSSVYTHYFTAPKACSLVVTVNGEGLDSGRISLTSDKGSNNLEYEIVSSDGNTLTIKFTVMKKTENIRFKLTNYASEPIEVSSLKIERADLAQTDAAAEPAEEAQTPAAG